MGFVPAKRTNRPPEAYELGCVGVGCDGLGDLPLQYYLPGTGQEPIDPGLVPKGLGWTPTGITAVGMAISTIGMAAGAYHGYKRNKSVGWAIGWGLLGGAFPILTGVVAVAQGYGKRKGR